jgi:hypothetical protein
MAKLDKAGLFKQLGYAPHPGQRAVHDCAASRRVLGCGARWGKSTVAAVEALCGLLAPTAPSRGWLVAPTYDLADQLLAGVLQYVEAHLAHRVIESSPRARKLVLRNLAGHAALLECRSCERPSNLVGAGLDWMIIDEAARVRDELWDTALSQRLTDRNGWLLACSTPRGCRGWFFDAYTRAIEGDLDYAAWSRPTEENSRIDPAVIEKERERLDRNAFHQEYRGEFIPDHGRVCPTCLGPRVDGPGTVVLRDGDEDLALCRDCGEPTHHCVSVMGMASDGGTRLKIIELRSEIPPDSVARSFAKGRWSA